MEESERLELKQALTAVHGRYYELKQSIISATMVVDGAFVASALALPRTAHSTFACCACALAAIILVLCSQLINYRAMMFYIYEVQHMLKVDSRAENVFTFKKERLFLYITVLFYPFLSLTFFSFVCLCKIIFQIFHY